MKRTNTESIIDSSQYCKAENGNSKHNLKNKEKIFDVLIFVKVRKYALIKGEKEWVDFSNCLTSVRLM